MGISGKLSAVTRSYKAASAWHGQGWNSSRLIASSRRSGVKLTGAFLLIAVVGAVVGSRASSANNLNANSTGNKKVTIQVSHTGSATPPAAPADSAPTPPADTNVSTSTDTANVSSGSDSSTQVTVNGQPVDIPADGSSQQTISSPGQQTTVQVSNSQDGSSATGGHSSTHTSVRVSSTSDNSTEDNATP
jgi:hypothetical protein